MCIVLKNIHIYHMSLIHMMYTQNTNYGRILMAMKEKEEKKTDGAEVEESEKKTGDAEEKQEPVSDVDLLKGILEKYSLDTVEQKLINKVISLFETTKTRQMLPSQNVGDSVFKMYGTGDEEPTEFVVDRIEFDEQGWKLISYEKFGVCEVDFVFPEKDYKKIFFDTAEEAKAAYKKAAEKASDKTNR